MNELIVGRIVHYFPNGAESQILPNGMEYAPAIVVQKFDECINLNVFTANLDDEPVRQAWSVYHKDHPIVTEGIPYWDWPSRG